MGACVQGKGKYKCTVYAKPQGKYDFAIPSHSQGWVPSSELNNSGGQVKHGVEEGHYYMSLFF